MPRNSAPSLRQVYQQWVEDQIEEYKDSVPRIDLLRLADEVCEELRVSQRGQYQLTEILLCEAVDRKIATMLKLPAYRSWVKARRASLQAFRGSPPATTEVEEESEDGETRSRETSIVFAK